MTLDKNINGYIVISDIIDGYWVTRRYMGYTKRLKRRRRWKRRINVLNVKEHTEEKEHYQEKIMKQKYVVIVEQLKH